VAAERREELALADALVQRDVGAPEARVRLC